jgi:hypothetical protein
VDSDEFVQLSERLLYDAEQAYRLHPSDANQRRVMKAWAAVRKARGEQHEEEAGAKRSHGE